jgi:UDPglucose 6-dehydrogenase
MKIAVAGTGFVSLFMAVLLAQRHKVAALDIVAANVYKINQRQRSIHDAEVTIKCKTASKFFLPVPIPEP